jgi:predicted nucleic acid-binding protein
MTGKVFMDTNLWVYLFSEETIKKESISQLVTKNFGNIRLSTQVLGELFHVLTKKKIVPIEEAIRIVYRILDDFPVSAIHKGIVKYALELKLKYRFSYWDSLIITSALDTGCDILYTEDMQHNQLIEGELKIINPFIGK